MTQSEDALQLDLRRGLPDALKVLLAEYPRQGWPDDPGYHGLVSMWLDRHMMFRRLLDRLTDDAAARLDNKVDPQRYLAGLSRFGGMFVNELHGHHQIEDHHYFPKLSQKDSRIEAGFTLLDADHHAMDGLLNRFVDGANTLLQAGPDGTLTKVGDFHGYLLDLQRLLDRHLVDEEELIVPVILKYGATGI